MAVKPVETANLTRLATYRVMGPVVEEDMCKILINKGARKDLGRPTLTPVQNKQGFMKFLS